MQTTGMQHITTVACHPQSNRMVERAHRQLKDALHARLAGTHWLEHLSQVVLGLLPVPNEDNVVSSVEQLYGAAMALPAELVQWWMRSRLWKSLWKTCITCGQFK